MLKIMIPRNLAESRKAPPPPGKNPETGSIHFIQFPKILVQLAEKPHPPPIHMRTSTTRRLPPIMKDYLPGMLTHLVFNFCWPKVHFVRPLIAPILDLCDPLHRFKATVVLLLHSYVLAHGEPKGHLELHLPFPAIGVYTV